MSLRVEGIERLTADAIAAQLVPERTATPVCYRSGQHVMLRVPTTAGMVERCYSLCSSPLTGEPMTIGIKRVVQGLASNWLVDNLRPGMALSSGLPSGRFVPRSLSSPFVLLAAGSGITPLLSIAKSALASGSPSVVLFYANRSRRDRMFCATIDDLGSHCAVSTIDWFEDQHGLPNVADLMPIITPDERTEIMACGPAGFLTVVDAAAASIGMKPDHVRRERFEPPPRNAPVAEPATAPTVASYCTRARLIVRGEPVTLKWPRDVLLLDAMIDEGIDIPYMCRNAYCGGCVGTITKGEVRMARNDVLDDFDIGTGRRLACQAYPDTDEVHIEFPD